MNNGKNESKNERKLGLFKGTIRNLPTPPIHELFVDSKRSSEKFVQVSKKANLSASEKK